MYACSVSLFWHCGKCDIDGDLIFYRNVIVQGDNLFHLFGPTFLPSSAAYMLAAALAMIPTVWLPDLKSLAVLGVCGIAATTTVASTVAYTLLSGSYSPGAVTTLVNLKTVPLVFGMFAFCFAGHGAMR